MGDPKEVHIKTEPDVVIVDGEQPPPGKHRTLYIRKKAGD